MWLVILEIINELLLLLEARVKDSVNNKEAIDNETFRKAMGSNDLTTAADLLRRRVQSLKESNIQQGVVGQGTANHSPK